MSARCPACKGDGFAPITDLLALLSCLVFGKSRCELCCGSGLANRPPPPPAPPLRHETGEQYRKRTAGKVAILRDHPRLCRRVDGEPRFIVQADNAADAAAHPSLPRFNAPYDNEFEEAITAFHITPLADDLWNVELQFASEAEDG